MLLNRRRAFRDAAVMLSLAAVITVLVATRRSAVQPIDDWVLDRMEAMRSGFVTDIGQALSVIGGAYVMWPLRVLSVGLLAWRRRWIQLTAFSLTIVTSEACIGPLKSLIDRPRPPAPLVDTGSASFPSGHAIAAAVSAAGIVIALIPPGRERLKWEIYAGLITFVMAMSRVYLGVHWLSDVVAGSLIGLGLALLWPAVMEEARARVRRPDAPKWIAARTRSRALRPGSVEDT